MSGGGSDNKKEVEKQFKYDKAVWQYDWDEMKRSEAHAMSSYLAETNNQTQIRDYEYDSSVRNWTDAAVIRDFDYANQRKAYNTSVEAYNEQLTYNELAEEIALDDNRRQQNDRYTQIGFQNEELLMNHDFTKTLSALELDQKIESGQVKAVRIGKGVRDAFDEATFSSTELLNQLNAARDEAAKKGTEVNLEGIQKAGKVLATGQTGRSARKNLQTVLAEQGRAQKAIADMLTREELGHTLNMEKMASKLDSLKADAKISYNDLAVQLSQAAEQAAVNLLQSEIKTGFSQRQLKESLKDLMLEWFNMSLTILTEY